MFEPRYEIQKMQSSYNLKFAEPKHKKKSAAATRMRATTTAPTDGATAAYSAVAASSASYVAPPPMVPFAAGVVPGAKVAQIVMQNEAVQRSRDRAKEGPLYEKDKKEKEDAESQAARLRARTRSGLFA